MNRHIPMLFNEDMIRAITTDRKTETRRAIKKAPRKHDFEFEKFYDVPPAGTRHALWKAKLHSGDQIHTCAINIQEGDLIWVRETHFMYGYWEESANGKRRFVRSDLPALFDNYLSPVKPNSETNVKGWYKRPSLFLEKKDSRITLLVTKVSIERLQEIDNDASMREGIERCNVAGQWRDYQRAGMGFDQPKDSYRSLWENINGEGSWLKNPWVKVIRFKIIPKNILEVI